MAYKCRKLCLLFPTCFYWFLRKNFNYNLICKQVCKGRLISRVYILIIASLCYCHFCQFESKSLSKIRHLCIRLLRLLYHLTDNIRGSMTFTVLTVRSWIFPLNHNSNFPTPKNWWLMQQVNMTWIIWFFYYFTVLSTLTRCRRRVPWHDITDNKLQKRWLNVYYFTGSLLSIGTSEAVFEAVGYQVVIYHQCLPTQSMEQTSRCK